MFLIDASRAEDDLPVLLEWDTTMAVAQGALRADGADLRFVTLPSLVPVPFWLESGIGTPATRAWVKLDLSSETTLVAACHGDPDAVSASDGRAVFDLFEDFESEPELDWQLMLDRHNSPASGVTEVRSLSGTRSLQLGPRSWSFGTWIATIDAPVGYDFEVSGALYVVDAEDCCQEAAVSLAFSFLNATHPGEDGRLVPGQVAWGDSNWEWSEGPSFVESRGYYYGWNAPDRFDRMAKRWMPADDDIWFEETEENGVWHQRAFTLSDLIGSGRVILRDGQTEDDIERIAISLHYSDGLGAGTAGHVDDLRVRRVARTPPLVHEIGLPIIDLVAARSE